MTVELVTVTFTTKAKVEDTTWPLVATSLAFVASLQVARVEDLSDARAIHYEAVWCDWAPTTSGARLRYVTGLQPLRRYRLTLEVRDA